ncbi:MAG: hypothetical protein ACXAAH_18150 [Promethearchaeota archaeon]|jgi:hypothetical protein
MGISPASRLSGCGCSNEFGSVTPGVRNSSCGCELVKSKNPNPRNFIISKIMMGSKHAIVSIKYPDCTNYEGKKILVFEDISFNQIQELSFVDPHFCDNGKHISPIARFVPTEDGWRMAIRFIKMLGEE